MKPSLAIHQAIRAGDLERLKECLAQGASIEEPDQEGLTPLMAACLNEKASLEMVEFLIGQGADLNASTEPPRWDMPDEFDFDEPDDPELKEIMASHEQFQELDIRRPLLSAVVQSASLEKIDFLIHRGADVHAISAQGYTAVICAACAGRMDAIRLLHQAGASLDGSTSYGESVIRVFSRDGHFAEVMELLAMGADPEPLQWTPLHHAVACGSAEEVEQLLRQGADPEVIDSWNRTAFHVAAHRGDVGIAQVLVDHGARYHAPGHCGQTALHYAACRDQVAMLQWLIGLGLSIAETDDFKHTPLYDAVEHSATGCFEALIDAGADWRSKDEFDSTLLSEASHPEIIRRLIGLGLNPAGLESDVLRDWIGLGTCDELPVTREEYLAGRFQRFGTSNPEVMKVAYWDAMVRNGWSAYRAAQCFDSSSFDRGQPIWCFARFGMSLTPLPDGRFVQIGGEHEDGYDPDFCIYNEVVIHDGKGNFQILGYPADAFPPTDFHSATLVGDWIYVIGNLGYPETRETFRFETPVFRFHVPTGRIDRVETKGQPPGWIHKHEATREGDSIRIAGGELMGPGKKGKSKRGKVHLLHLQDHRWEII